MSIYTIVDSNGETVTKLSANAYATVLANVPSGGAAIEGEPPEPDAYWASDQWNLRPLPESPGYTWDPVTKTWVDLRTLVDAKFQKKQQLTEAWTTDLYSGVTFDGKTAPTTATAWVDYLTIHLAAQDVDWVDTPIQLSDGSFEELTQAEVALLWSALKLKRHTLATKASDKFALVDAATTIAEVDAVIW